MNNWPSILLIEDDKEDQDFFIHTLCEISEAPPVAVVSNGKEALDRLYRSMILPTLIFMDINMPFMSGMECLKYIKDDPLIKDIPVIMFTTSNEHEELAILLGAHAYIQKPNTVEKLKAALETIIHLCVPGYNRLSNNK